MSTQQVTEQEVLAIMKRILTDIAKETFTRAGVRHPLSDETINNMRECLKLISIREADFSNNSGDVSPKRPHYVDEPKKSVVVSMLDLKSKSSNTDDKT
ncbi:segregation and condensation protein A [Beggiatoa alba]|nr:segregation and condensation protein A [Beggiatoa alba]